MHLGILARINHGYDHLEPVILGLMALGKSFMLIGRHGTGKTRLARVLSTGLGNGSFGFYDATKDDLISIAGIPDVQAMSSGALRFVAHERSIWDKTTIVVDEITRAGKESQNLWLEILEQRTCFGLPLQYRSIVATANPESYAAAFQLDEALLDRFYAVLPVPEMQEELTTRDVAAMIGLSGDAATPDATELGLLFTQIHQAHAALLAEGAQARVVRYVAEFVPALFATLSKSDGRYVSVRTYARNLPETIMAVAAYFRVAGANEPLRRGAAEAVRYAVATKLQIRPVVLEQIHRAMEHLLGDGVIPDSERIRLDFAQLESFEAQLSHVEQHWETLVRSMRADELEKMLGLLVRKATNVGQRERLVSLRAALSRVNYTGDGLRQVDGQLTILYRRAVAQLTPQLTALARSAASSPREREAQRNVIQFLELNARGSLLQDHSTTAVRLKRYLIDALEDKAPSDREALVDLFADLRLSEQG